MKHLSPIDAAFLRTESPRTPMHVGAMLTFRLPENAPPDFLQRLLKRMRDYPFMPEPFISPVVSIQPSLAVADLAAIPGALLRCVRLALPGS